MASLSGIIEELSFPMIIAVKGNSSNRKREIATKLAKLLKYPLIDEGDVICALSNPIFSNFYKDLAFEIATKIASTQLRLNLNVIINCELSDHIQIDQLKELANSREGCLLIIIECEAEIDSSDVGNVPRLYINPTKPFVAEEFVPSILDAAKFVQELNLKMP